jgi:hypothetical protein
MRATDSLSLGLPLPLTDIIMNCVATLKAWQPEGDFIATAGSDGMVTLWKWYLTPPQRLTKVIQFPHQGVNTVAFSPKPQQSLTGSHNFTLVSAGTDNVTRFWKCEKVSILFPVNPSEIVKCYDGIENLLPREDDDVPLFNDDYGDGVGSGQADLSAAVTGQCSGNDDRAEDVDCSSGDGTFATNTMNKGGGVTGSDAATCCAQPQTTEAPRTYVGTCNQKVDGLHGGPVTDEDCGVGYFVRCSSLPSSEERWVDTVGFFVRCSILEQAFASPPCG